MQNKSTETHQKALDILVGSSSRSSSRPRRKWMRFFTIIASSFFLQARGVMSKGCIPRVSSSTWTRLSETGPAQTDDRRIFFLYEYSSICQATIVLYITSTRYTRDTMIRIECTAMIYQCCFIPGAWCEIFRTRVCGCGMNVLQVATSLPPHPRARARAPRQQ